MSQVPALIQDIDVPDVPVARTNVNLLQIVWQRKSLVILGIVFGILMGCLYWAQRAPTYESQAQILVVKKNPDIIGRDTTNYLMEDYMSTQQEVLKSVEIARRAANHPDVKVLVDAGKIKSFPVTKPDDLIFELRSGLTVMRQSKDGAGSPQSGTNVLLLSFRGPIPDECTIFLRAIIDGYQEFLNDKYSNQNDLLKKSIHEAQEDLAKKVDAKEKELSEHLFNSTVTSKQAGGTSSLQKQYEAMSTEIAKRHNELDTKQADLRVFEDIYQKNGPHATIAAINTAGYKNVMGGDTDYDKKLMELTIRKEELLSKVGVNHPDVKQVDDQIKSINKNVFKKDQKSEADANGSGGLDRDAAKVFLDGLRYDVERLTKTLHELDNNYEKLQQNMKKAGADDLKEEKIRRELTNAQQLYLAIVSKINQLDMTKNGGLEASKITPPTIGIKIAPKPFQVFSAAGLLGTLLGMGLAYLAEISDKSFRNPVEIRKRLGLPVIGHVPYLAGDDKAQELVAGGSSTVDPMIITHYQSSSIGAEAYRGVRTALYFSTRGEAHQVIQVTSPNVGDGKSTLAANLAVSIAQSNKRTLLIDADFRKPRVHKIFNVPAQTGMASVMAGQCDLASAIQQTAVPNLSVLPCGPRPVNPAELLTSPKFKELLDELRTQFDFVIVDTPPILVVTDPAVVAPRVDGVILCIRVTKNGRPFAERAREVLTSLGANIIGVVVNGFGAQVGGGKYGYEHYHYGYGESYTYGYTYADKEAESYYGDKTQELALPPGE